MRRLRSVGRRATGRRPRTKVDTIQEDEFDIGAVILLIWQSNLEHAWTSNLYHTS